MSKKILIVGIIIAVITIIAVSVTLVLINLEKNNNPNVYWKFTRK